MAVNRSSILVDPSSILQKASNLDIIVFKKRICTNNTAVNTRDISEPSITQKNNSKVVRRDNSEPSIIQKKNYISDTGVNRREIAESFITKKTTNTTNTELKKISTSIFESTINQRKKCKTDTEVIRREHSITQDSPSRVPSLAFKEQKNTNNTVSYSYSNAQLSLKDNSIEVKQHIIESAQLDKCVHVRSGLTKNKSNVNESSSEVPNVTKNNKQCRACLKKGSTPIYAEDSNEDLAEAIKTIGGVEISTNDCYPKYLCKFCLKLLLSGVLFRKTVQTSDKIFRKSLTGIKQVPIKINNILSENEDISDTDFISDDEELSVLNKHPQRHTELPDHNVIKLFKQPISRLEPKAISNNNSRDNDNSNNEVDKPLQKNVDHNIDEIKTTNLINCVKYKGRHHYGNKLRKYLDQNMTKILQTSSNSESALPFNFTFFNNSDQHSDKANTSQNVPNQTISKVLQNVSETKLEKANKINIARSNGISNTIQECNEQNKNDKYSDKNDNTLQKCNKQNMTDDYDDDNDNTLQEYNDTNAEYFGDKDNSYREPTVLDKINKKPDFLWRCEECDLEYKLCREYVAHNMSEHPEKNKLPCLICQKSFSPGYLARHVYYHEIGPFVCDVCGKKILNLDNFKTHRKIHTTEFLFKCSLCSYRGASKVHLKLHMITHSKEKPYKCHLCPKQFHNSGNLKRHTLCHKGERPFKCTCELSFFSKGDLGRHIKSAHLGIKKGHNCRICDKSFTSMKKTLEHELNVHNKPKLPAHGVPNYLKHDLNLKQ